MLVYRSSKKKCRHNLACCKMVCLRCEILYPPPLPPSALSLSWCLSRVLSLFFSYACGHLEATVEWDWLVRCFWVGFTAALQQTPCLEYRCSRSVHLGMSFLTYVYVEEPEKSFLPVCALQQFPPIARTLRLRFSWVLRIAVPAS